VGVASLASMPKAGSGGRPHPQSDPLTHVQNRLNKIVFLKRRDMSWQDLVSAQTSKKGGTGGGGLVYTPKR